MSPEVAKAFEITKQVCVYVESMPRSRVTAVMRSAVPNSGGDASKATQSTWESWVRGDSLMSLVDLLRIAVALNMRVDQLILAASCHSGVSPPHAKAPNTR